MRISDPDLARVFEDSPKRRILLSFVDEPRSVSAVAAMVQRPLAQVHYHVTSLEGLGLLKVQREQKRRGRPVKLYRTVASSFLLPLNLLSDGPFSRLARELRDSLNNELIQTDPDGVLFSVEGGEPTISWFRASGQGSNRADEYWQVLQLDRASVRALAQDIEQLMKKYQSLSGSGEPYLLHAAFGPRRR